jgi:hypothetical protein
MPRAQPPPLRRLSRRASRSAALRRPSRIYLGAVQRVGDSIVVAHYLFALLAMDHPFPSLSDRPVALLPAVAPRRAASAFSIPVSWIAPQTRVDAARTPAPPVSPLAPPVL